MTEKPSHPGEESNFIIRPGTERDVPEMLRLWREMVDSTARQEPLLRHLPSPVGEQVWEKYLRESILGNKDCCVLVAEIDGKLIGQIIGVIRDSIPILEPEQFGNVTDTVVDPAARRRGAGQALFEALKTWFRQRGISSLRLPVLYNNSPAQTFWRKMGCTDYADILRYDLGCEEKH
jgi:ribosomal protein S18 acetylase RimI-like enzyme